MYRGLDSRKCEVICTFPLSPPTRLFPPFVLQTAKYFCEWCGSVFAIRSSGDALNPSALQWPLLESLAALLGLL